MKNSSKGPSPSELAVQSTYKAPVVLTKHRTIPSQVHTTANHVALNHAPPSRRSRHPIRSSTGPTKRTKPNIHSNVGQEGIQKRIKLNHDTNDYDKNDTTNTATTTKNDDDDPKKRLTDDLMETPNDESHPQEQEQQQQQQSHVNAYDSMLGEIHDLLMAAQEAQSLGRLRMASTYQMLAHTRLIGLGKRFDRCLIRPENQPSIPLSNNINMLPLDDTSSAITAKNLHGATEEDLILSQSSTAHPTTDRTHPMLTSPTNTHGTIQTIQHRSDAQAALAKMLPSNVNVDDTMMEHLARAAMELHNKRTGRGMQSERVTSFQTIPQQGTFMEHVTSFLSNTTTTSTTATTNRSGSQTKNRLLLKKGMQPYSEDHHDNDDDDVDNDDDDDDDDDDDNVPTTIKDEDEDDDKHKEDDEEGKGHQHDTSSPDRQKRKRGKSQPKAMLTV